MGQYINTGFQISRNSEYIDKSGLIRVVNSTLFTRSRFNCVSRCRRFGKSMAAEMLCAYYDNSCDSRKLFEDLEIANDLSFEKYLNKFPVIYLDMTGFVTRFKDESIIKQMNVELNNDIHKVYPDVPIEDGDDLMQYLIRISETKQDRFFFIIDEWDAILREFKTGTETIDDYVNWLRRMFKDVAANNVFAGVYMTGILPIKKYRTESALMFNPNSVIQAIDSNWCTSYWGKTGAYDAVADYIQMNFDGLKDSVICLLGGGRVKVNTSKFRNDLSTIQTRDDVLTVLIHLGYLSYDRTKSECYVPNYEVFEELNNAVEDTKWTNVTKALQQSEKLFQATLDGDEEAVAQGVDAAHDENTSILSYNNENSLACVLSIAYYYAKNDYIIHREFPTGKGFADLVLIPRKNVDSPAIILELKYNKDADTAISQIKRKQYPDKVKPYANHLLLVGINYDKEQKKHQCCIEYA